MGVLHVAGATPSGDPTSSYTITIPSGTQTNDVLLLVHGQDGVTTDPSVTDNDTGGNTWTKIIGRSGGTRAGSVWWKRATASTASKTITVSQGSCTSMAGVISVFRGCLESGNPYEGEISEANASANEDMAAITPSVKNTMVILGVIAADDASTSSASATSPATFTLSVEKLSIGGADSAASLWYGLQTAAVTTGTVSWSQTPNSQGSSYLFALKPSIAAGSFLGIFE